MPKFHTLKEVADIFRVTTKTLRRWIEEGKHFDRSALKKIPNGPYLVPDYEVRRLSDKFSMEKPEVTNSRRIISRGIE